MHSPVRQTVRLYDRVTVPLYHCQNVKLSHSAAVLPLAAKRSYVKSVYHGNTERYVDNQLQSEDLYVQGVKTSSTYCYERDSKRYMTWTPYAQVDGKSVRHGIARRY